MAYVDAYALKANRLNIRCDISNFFDADVSYVSNSDFRSFNFVQATGVQAPKLGFPWLVKFFRSYYTDAPLSTWAALMVKPQTLHCMPSKRGMGQGSVPTHLLALAF